MSSPSSGSTQPKSSEQSCSSSEPNLMRDQSEVTSKVAARIQHTQEEKKDECPISSSSIDENPQEDMLPLISLSHGLQKKASGYTLRSWIALSLTLDGRDKITKVIQYTARLLSWWFTQKTMENPIFATKFKNLYKSLSQSRKAFRLGRSFTEMEKLRSMGLLQVLLYHLRIALNDNNVFDNEEDGDGDKLPTELSTNNNGRPHLTRKASSNIGWGPSTMPSLPTRQQSSSSRGFYRSLSNVGYRMYRPMVSQLSLLGPPSRPSKAPAWNIIGSSLKLLGLLGFFAGDNICFLNSSGLFDNHALKEQDRLTKRKQLQTSATHFAFRSYFMGAVAGLVVSWKSYWEYRRKEIKDAQERLDRLCKESENIEEDVRVKRARQDMKEAGEKQFVLFLALLKSCCDILVFSNNAGIDLHKKYRGKKMHEGFHCLCGLVSASTVIYNNFPNADY